MERRRILYITYIIHIIQLSVDVGTYLVIFLNFLIPIPVWDIKSEAFRFEKSFEHSHKASKPLFYIVINDFNIKNAFQCQQIYFLNKI